MMAITLGTIVLLLRLNLAVSLPAPAIEGKVPVICMFGGSWSGVLDQGRRQGQGEYLWLDGSCLRGVFVDDEPHGPCTYIYPTGRMKRMIFERGRLVSARLLSLRDEEQGGGRFGRFQAQGSYDGWYRGDPIKGYQPHGRGTMVFRNGSRYSGQWHNGRMHGNGTITWHDGGSYQGQWLAGRRTGTGTYRWPDGRRYTGQWRDNVPCGEGILHHPDGRVERGIWPETRVTVVDSGDND